MGALAGILTVFLLFLNLGVDNLLADTVEKTFPVASAVELTTDGGSIDLIGSDTRKIELDIESKKEFDKYYEISSDVENGVLKIEIERKDKGFSFFKMFNDNNSLRIQVSVPFNTDCTLHTSGGSLQACSLDGDLTAHTSGGSIDCCNLHGEVDLHTSGGSVSCKRIAGDLTAKTSGGSIKLEKVCGNYIAKTSGGSIHAECLHGDGELNTSGGKISLAECKGAVAAKTSGGGIDVDSHEGSLVARTSAGSVSASFISPPTGDCVLKTSAGSIKLAMPDRSGCWLDAHTSAGSVNCDLAVSNIDAKDRSHLSGKIGGGGPKVTLETSAGSIRVSAVN